jgi:hypothetical protein
MSDRAGVTIARKNEKTDESENRSDVAGERGSENKRQNLQKYLKSL